MLPGLIMDMPLMISSAIQYAATYHAETEIVARGVDGAIHRYNYGEAHRRMKRLANAVGRLGVKPGDRIGTLGWNTHRHFELFYGVSGSGAVLHPVNPRLFPDQIAYIVNHAEDAWLFIDEVTLPLAEQLAPRLAPVKGFVLMADRSAMPKRTTLGTLLCYEELLAAESDDYVWPQFDERSASSICYTSGTTGDPKGVMYSHRSSVLVSLLFTEWVYRGGRSGALETLMSLAPLFHANGWYFPYVAPMTGSKMVLPGRNYEPAMLYELLDGERITITAGVPTMWLMLTDWMEREGRKLPHLRAIYSAGTAAPQSLIEKVASWGIEMSQLWGMTEALGLTTPSLRPGALNLPPEQQRAERMNAGGRAGFGAQLRIVDDADTPLPHDGVAVGHLRAWTSRRSTARSATSPSPSSPWSTASPSGVGTSSTCSATYPSRRTPRSSARPGLGWAAWTRGTAPASWPASSERRRRARSGTCVASIRPRKPWPWASSTRSSPSRTCARKPRRGVGSCWRRARRRSPWPSSPSTWTPSSEREWLSSPSPRSISTTAPTRRWRGATPSWRSGPSTFASSGSSRGSYGREADGPGGAGGGRRSSPSMSHLWTHPSSSAEALQSRPAPRVKTNPSTARPLMIPHCPTLNGTQSTLSAAAPTV